MLTEEGKPGDDQVPYTIVLRKSTISVLERGGKRHCLSGRGFAGRLLELVVAGEFGRAMELLKAEG